MLSHVFIDNHDANVNYNLLVSIQDCHEHITHVSSVLRDTWLFAFQMCNVWPEHVVSSQLVFYGHWVIGDCTAHALRRVMMP